MLRLAIICVFLAILVIMSLVANNRFRSLDRLPMQWTINGEVGWWAPRIMALSLMPILAVILLGGTAAATAFAMPGHVQDDAATRGLLITAASFVAVHALHLVLIARTALRNHR